MNQVAQRHYSKSHCKLHALSNFLISCFSTATFLEYPMRRLDQKWCRDHYLNYNIIKKSNNTNYSET